MEMKNKHVYTVLEQLPLRKITSYPKNNPNPNPNPNQEAIFLGGNHLVAPQSKTNPDLDPTPNPNRGGGRQFSLGVIVWILVYTKCVESHDARLLDNVILERSSKTT